MKVAITPEIMTKAWNLHIKGVEAGLIADTLGVSYESVKRIVKIMTAAQNGENVDAIGGTNHKKQKAFAKQMFGIAEKEEEPEPITEQNSSDSLKEFMEKVLLSLAWQNELLEQILNELGVDWRKNCKGERR